MRCGLPRPRSGFIGPLPFAVRAPQADQLHRHEQGKTRRVGLDPRDPEGLGLRVIGLFRQVGAGIERADHRVFRGKAAARAVVVAGQQGDPAIGRNRDPASQFAMVAHRPGQDHQRGQCAQRQPLSDHRGKPLPQGPFAQQGNAQNQRHDHQTLRLDQRGQPQHQPGHHGPEDHAGPRHEAPAQREQQRGIEHLGQRQRHIEHRIGIDRPEQQGEPRGNFGAQHMPRQIEQEPSGQTGQDQIDEAHGPDRRPGQAEQHRERERPARRPIGGRRAMVAQIAASVGQHRRARKIPRRVRAGLHPGQNGDQSQADQSREDHPERARLLQRREKCPSHGGRS